MKPGRFLLSITAAGVTGVDVVANAQFVTAVRGRWDLHDSPMKSIGPRQDQEAEAERRTTVVTRTATARVPSVSRSSRTSSPSTIKDDDNSSQSSSKTDDTQTSSAPETFTTTEAETTSSASPSATESSVPASEEASGLSPGTAAGIAAGAVAGVALIGLLIFFLWRKKQGGIRGAVVTADYPDTMNMVDTKGQQYPEPTLPDVSRNGSLNDDPYFAGVKDEFAFAVAGPTTRRQSSFSPSQVGMAMSSPPQQYGAYRPPPQDQQQSAFTQQQTASPSQQQQQFAFTQTSSPGQPQQQFAYVPAQPHLSSNQQYYQQQQQFMLPPQGGDFGAGTVPYRPVSAFTAYPSPGHPILPVSPLTPHRQSIGMGPQPSPYYPPHPSQPPQPLQPPRGAENMASPNLPGFMIPGGNKSRAMSFSAGTSSQSQYEGGAGEVEGDGRQEWAASTPPPVPAMPAAVALVSPPLSPLRRNPV